MLWQISLLIISIAFLILVAFAVPSLLQIRRTTKSLEITSKTLNQNLPGILTNIDEITTNITDVTHSVKSQVEGLSGAVRKIQEMIEDVVNFEKTLRTEVETPVVETLGTLTAVVKGIRTFLDVLRSKS